MTTLQQRLRLVQVTLILALSRSSQQLTKRRSQSDSCAISPWYSLINQQSTNKILPCFLEGILCSPTFIFIILYPHDSSRISCVGARRCAQSPQVLEAFSTSFDDLDSLWELALLTPWFVHCKTAAPTKDEIKLSSAVSVNDGKLSSTWLCLFMTF
jgi:hypothetical protein